MRDRAGHHSTWSPLTAGDLGLADIQTPVINDTWWKAFGDAQLDTLIDQALHGSPTLAAALARMHQAQAELSANRAGSYPANCSRRPGAAPALQRQLHHPATIWWHH
ncbi:MAG: hypothetical protein R3F24_10210 [Gammaproteobacteria bacterium]